MTVTVVGERVSFGEYAVLYPRDTLSRPAVLQRSQVRADTEVRDRWFRFTNEARAVAAICWPSERQFGICGTRVENRCVQMLENRGNVATLCHFGAVENSLS